MLITQLKPQDEIISLAEGKTVALCCEGCKEVYFPEAGVSDIQSVLSSGKTTAATIITDYICNPENLELLLKKHKAPIDSADTILVFSCGVGVQTVAEMFDGKNVSAACDTIPLPGGQGVTPLEYDCAQCGECYLKATGGICPITACSKSLVNGQCGGSKNGKCEVDGDMECGWERIYRRLEKQGRLSAFNQPAKIRNFAADAAHPESEENL